MGVTHGEHEKRNLSHSINITWYASVQPLGVGMLCAKQVTPFEGRSPHKVDGVSTLKQCVLLRSHSLELVFQLCKTNTNKG